MTTQIIHGDCLDAMRTMESGSVDLVFTSPPYEDARTYNIGFKHKKETWVEWAVARFIESYRVSRGLTAWVVEGRTRQFRWSATPALMMAELHRAGVKLRKPPIFHRVGIAGSGGPDWLRNDYEFIVCASHGRLPWSDNTAMGHPPKYPPGGMMSHRHADGQRKNARQPKKATQGRKNGDAQTLAEYVPPKIANPGNVVKCLVGGGHMGNPICHENEAPFPESLAEFFIRSFCPPGGTVLDPFAGSFTTCAVAEKWGRVGIGIDIRDSQLDIGRRRLAGESRAA